MASPSHHRSDLTCFLPSTSSIISTHFSAFLTRLSDRGEKDISSLSTPHGWYGSEQVLHVLHCPPKNGKELPFDSVLDPSNRTIKFLANTFPDLPRHDLLDIYAKRVRLSDPCGSRLRPSKLYGNDPLLGHHYAFAQKLINLSRARIRIFYGQHVLKFVRKFVAWNKYKIDISIPHPEFIMRYAKPYDLQMVHATFSELKSYGIKVNLACLNRRMRYTAPIPLRLTGLVLPKISSREVQEQIKRLKNRRRLDARKYFWSAYSIRWERSDAKVGLEGSRRMVRSTDGYENTYHEREYCWNVSSKISKIEAGRYHIEQRL